MLGLQNLFEELCRQPFAPGERMAGPRSRRTRKEILYHRVRELIEQIGDPEQVHDGLHEQIHRFMAANLHRRPTLKDLAAFLGYSEKYCSDFFKVMMGEPFSQYGKRLRLEQAQRLLADGQATLAQIADSLGFSDQFAFSHFFKRAVGCAPNQFRERSRGATCKKGKAH